MTSISASLPRIVLKSKANGRRERSNGIVWCIMKSMRIGVLDRLLRPYPQTPAVSYHNVQLGQDQDGVQNMHPEPKNVSESKTCTCSIIDANYHV